MHQNSCFFTKHHHSHALQTSGVSLFLFFFSQLIKHTKIYTHKEIKLEQETAILTFHIFRKLGFDNLLL